MRSCYFDIFDLDQRGLLGIFVLFFLLLLFFFIQVQIFIANSWTYFRSTIVSFLYVYVTQTLHTSFYSLTCSFTSPIMLLHNRVYVCIEIRSGAHTCTFMLIFHPHHPLTSHRCILKRRRNPDKQEQQHQFDPVKTRL